MSLRYLALELRRLARSSRFVIFTVAFPVLLFMLYVSLFTAGQAPAEQAATTKTLMVSMTAFGTMVSGLFLGPRVAAERHAGWQRQLRLTPLSGAGYLVAKAITGMAMAVVPALLVPLVGGLVEGVSLDPLAWVRVSLGVWLAGVPFVLLGLLIGQVGSLESTQPITQLVMLPMALLGGIFIPLEAMPSWLHDVAQVLPSYWLAQIGRGAVTGDLADGLGTDVLVLAAWTVGLGLLVMRRYRAGSARA